MIFRRFSASGPLAAAAALWLGVDSGESLQRITQKWRRFSKLSGFERAIVVEAAAGLMVTWAALRLVGFQRWQGFLGRLAPPPERALSCSTMDSARLISQMQASAARNLFFRPNCLEHSVTLWWLLQSRRIAAELRIGGRKEKQRFTAHAWVECGGTVLNEPDETHLQFSPFEGPVVSRQKPAI